MAREDRTPAAPDLLEGVDFVALFLVLAWMYGLIVAGLEAA